MTRRVCAFSLVPICTGVNYALLRPIGMTRLRFSVTRLGENFAILATFYLGKFFYNFTKFVEQFQHILCCRFFKVSKDWGFDTAWR